MLDHLTADEAPSLTVGQDGSGLLTGPDGMTMPAEFHPLAQLFPMIEGEAFASLVEDVKANGVRRPVVMYEGKILDGRNRYLAAREAGVGYPVAEFTGDDPVAYVVSENIHRRHLTESQRAMVAKKLETTRHGGVRQGQDANLHLDRAGAAHLLSVSPRSVATAATVLDHGAPELVAAVEAGQVTVSAAAEVAKLPEAEQVEIVAKGPEAVKAAAKEARHPKIAAPQPEPEPVDPERRKIAKLTTEAMIDEITGLRAALADSKAKEANLKAERDDLKSRIAELTADDQGKVISKLQKQLQAAKFSRDEALAATKRMEYRLHKAEARTKELESLPIEMGAL